MLVAALLVHLPMGVFIDNGGWALVGALGAGALLLAAVGAGRYSVDRVLPGGKKRRSRGRSASTSAASSGAAAEKSTVDATS